MGIISLPAFRFTNIKRRLVAALALCVLFMAVSANAYRGTLTSSVSSVSKDAEIATQEIRIKRLKLADPESTETMLADNGLAVAGGSQSRARHSA